MNKLHANHLSASEMGGEYFQVMFEEERESDKAYFLIQRQFEIPGDGSCYVESHKKGGAWGIQNQTGQTQPK